MRLLVGVSRSPESPLCPLIDAVTHARLSAPWSLQDGPATHALTVIDPEAGDPQHAWWRLDAMGPCAANPLGRATWRPYRVGNPDQMALWHVDLPEARFGITVARAQDGRHYDVGRLAAQLSLMLAKAPGLPHHDICTELVVEVLQACGPQPRAMADAMSDLLPERLGQLLRVQPWARRLV